MTVLPPPELSRTVKLSEIGNSAKTATLLATEDECTALAKRFDLPSIKSISAEYVLKANDEKITFAGTIHSKLQQMCAISGEAFSVTIKEPFNIAFVDKIAEPENEEEIELEADDCDLIAIDGNQIDIGEAAAQTLYLALPPYPRGPAADQIAAKAGLKSEAEAGPFGVLAALKDKLG